MNRWTYPSKNGKDIIIRVATADDLESIMNIWNAMVDEKKYTMGRDKFTPEDEQVYFDSLSEREFFLVALLDDVIVGYSLVTTHYKGSGSTDHVAYSGTWVVKTHRESGVGRALLESSLELARDNDYEKMVVHIRASNQRSLSFYKATGFLEIGVYKKHIKIDGEYDDWVILEKFLS